jgi:hypothetical protein
MQVSECCEAFDVVAFNFGALSMRGASGREVWRLGSWEEGGGGGEGQRGKGVLLAEGRDFVSMVTTDQWLGEWQPGGWGKERRGGEGQGVLHGASGLGAPEGGFRRGSSNLMAAITVALSCLDASEVCNPQPGGCRDAITFGYGISA